MPRLTIQNLIKRTETLQARMSLDALSGIGSSFPTYQRRLRELSDSFRESSQAAGKLLAKLDHSAADLPVRSRRAYQWLVFLAQGSNLDEHLDALRRVGLFLPGIKRLPRLRQPRVEFLFYHLGVTYKIKPDKSNLLITAQEAFIRAPDKVLIAILETALAGKGGDARGVIRDYTFTRDYQTDRTLLEYLAIPPGSYSRGRVHDLEISYARMNQEYFRGEIPRPHLVWSDRLTYRKFGHYQWDIDTVMISQTLDQPRVPEYVLDYVMYHELLHKQLGIRRVNNRSMAHTGAFRKAEIDFRHIKEAREYLNKLAQKRS
jgi:hypothetical protein